VVFLAGNECTGDRDQPSDLLLIAVASCTAVDIVEIPSKKRMPLNHSGNQLQR